MMTDMKLLLLCCLAVFSLDGIHGHGMLMDPVNRSSAWRKGFKTPINFDDDSNDCGGLSVQNRNNRKCGTCGDDYRMQQPRPNENTGKYGTGTIVKTYKSGELIELTARITANHGGYFQFAVCPLMHEKELETEECFNRNPITLETGDVKYKVPNHNPGDFKLKGYLPAGLTCEHCVFRWQYTAGNNRGICEDCQSREGCGSQETIRTCSDIKIV